MAPPIQSVCWKLLTLQADRKTAVCNICQAQLSYHQSTNLLRHLRTKHPFQLQQNEELVSSKVTPAVQLSNSAQLQPGPSQASTSTPLQVSDGVISAPELFPISYCTDQSTKQLTIQATKEKTTKYKPNSLRKRELDECILDLVTVDMLPMSVVENRGFRRLVNKLDPRYKILSRKKLTNQLLPAKYHEERLRLKQMMKEVKHVSITTDCWTSRAVESYMTVTVHFVTGDWQLQSRVLTTMALQGSDTADTFSSTLKEVFAEWEISEKVTTCVTDNAANIVSAIEKLNLRHQPCFGHALNLAVEDSIKRTDEVFNAKNKLKAVVTFFHHSTLGTNNLKEAHKISQTTFRKLKQDVETGWYSFYEMIESYIGQHDQVTMALILSGKPALCINTYELEVLKMTVSTLEGFYEATVELSSKRYTTVAKIIPLVAVLRRMISNDSSPLGICLFQQLQERFKTLDTNPHLHEHVNMATLLDPRFKRKGFSNSGASDSAVQILMEVAGSIQLPQSSATQGEKDAATEEATPPPAKKTSLLWSNFDRQVMEKQQITHNRVTAIEPEIRRHLETANISRDANPLDYWKDHHASLPRLSLIARDVLSIPATSVPGERLFSKADKLISRKRSTLKAKNVDMILFLNNIQE